MKHSYRIRKRFNGWWNVEVRYWWLPFWFDFHPGAPTADGAITLVRSIVETQRAERRYIPTIIELGKLP